MNFMLLVARAISHSFAALTREILFLPLEHKIHIFSPPCNILYAPKIVSKNCLIVYWTHYVNIGILIKIKGLSGRTNFCCDKSFVHVTKMIAPCSSKVGHFLYHFVAVIIKDK